MMTPSLLVTAYLGRYNSPNTPQVQRLLRKEGRAHVFNNYETLKRVTQTIIECGERTGANDEDDYE
jgi:hypothetical protein